MRVTQEQAGRLASLVDGAVRMGFAVILNENQNGTNLTQISYTDNDNYRDEWEIYKLNYYAVVYNYYDSGYSVRYNESGTASQQKIDEYNYAIAERYMQLLGLAIQYETAEYYNSPIDICKGTVTSENIDALCSHSGTIHTERESVISDFSQNHQGSGTVTNTFWSCHKIMSTATNGNRDENRSHSRGFCIYILEICRPENRDLYSTGVLMHELNHQYGARDHYHEEIIVDGEKTCKFKDICSRCGDNPRDSECIMFQSRIDITQESVICDACLGEMRAHLELHHKY